MQHTHLKLLILISFPFLLFSCVNTKKLDTVWVYKNQHFYESKKVGKDTSVVLKDNITRPCVAKIDQHDSLLSIVILEGDYTSDTIKKYKSEPLHGGLFFPFADTIQKKKTAFVKSDKIRYLQISPSLQAATIPLKVRFAQGDHPYNAAGSVNIGFSFGWKFTNVSYRNYYYRKTNLFVKAKSSNFSFTPSIFLGPSIIELTTTNTNIQQDVNVLGVTDGAMIVFGVDKLSVGLAVGSDYVLGSKFKSWIYEGKPWIGLSLAVDFSD